MSDKKIKIDIQPIGKRILLNEPANGLKSIIDAGIEINIYFPITIPFITIPVLY